MEIFSHDKLAILLNAVDSGLYLRGVKSLNKEQCYLLTTFVVFGAGDAMVLADLIMNMVALL